MSSVPEPPDATVALTAFRELPDGRGRQYTEVWFPDRPWPGCEHFIRTCGALGFLRESSPARAYALLDALGEDGEILATYDVPHAQAFKYIYRKLHLRVSRDFAPTAAGTLLPHGSARAGPTPPKSRRCSDTLQSTPPPERAGSAENAEVVERVFSD